MVQTPFIHLALQLIYSVFGQLIEKRKCTETIVRISPETTLPSLACLTKEGMVGTCLDNAAREANCVDERASLD